MVTRSVRDCAAVLDATTAPFAGSLYAQPPRPRSYAARLERAPRRLTVWVTRRSFLDEDLHPGCATAVDDAAALLESLGHRVVELALPIEHVEVARAYLTVLAAAVAADVRATEHKTGRAPKAAMFERPTWFLEQVGDALSARELWYSHEVAASTAQRLAPGFAQVDVHLSATMAAPRHGSASSRSAWPRRPPSARSNGCRRVPSCCASRCGGSPTTAWNARRTHRSST